jgi:hypothetical protein
MQTIWLIPVHVRPVVSFEGLKRNEIIDPAMGLDRFNLTDVGDAFFQVFNEAGADIITKGVELPFPWEMVFKVDKEPKASLRGLKVGPSTYRSIFKLVFFEGDDLNGLIRNILDRIGRDTLESPYWDDGTWQLFQKLYKLSKNNVFQSNDDVIGNL